MSADIFFYFFFSCCFRITETCLVQMKAVFWMKQPFPFPQSLGLHIHSLPGQVRPTQVIPISVIYKFLSLPCQTALCLTKANAFYSLIFMNT